MKLRYNSKQWNVWNRCMNWKFESAYKYFKKLKPEYQKEFGKYGKEIKKMAETYGNIGWLFRGKIANKISKWFGEFDNFCDKFKTKGHLEEEKEEEAKEMKIGLWIDGEPQDEFSKKIQKRFNKNLKFIKGGD